MRTDLIGAGAIGFALGMLCLGVALGVSGKLNTAAARRTAPAPSIATGWPDLSKIPGPPPLEPAPADLARNLPVPQGEADRSLPSDHPIVPIAGIAANSLTDTFNDMRDGQKHEALDIPAQRGTPVRAAVEGNVVKLFTSKQGGLTVYQFDDSRNLCYYYAHLDHYAAGLQEGALLRQGDILGYVGSTGNASPQAPHLHFAVFRLGPDKKWYRGTAIDPLPLLR